MKSHAVVRRRAIVFPLACLVAVVMVLISESSYWRSNASLDGLGELATTRFNIHNLEKSVLAAEALQRAYLLTGRSEYLLPFADERRKIDEALDALAAHWQDDPMRLQLLGGLREQVLAKLSELATTLALHDEGKRQLSIELVMSNIGKEHMDGIRAISRQLLVHETARMGQVRTDVFGTLMLNRLGVAALSAISLLALFLYLRQTQALERQEQQVKRSVQAERDRLEIEVAHRTAELTELARHLQTAREDERGRLARDLHDELGALLTSAKLDAARIRSRLAGTAPEAQERLAHLVATLNSGIAMKRRIIEDLRPSSLANLGLVETLEILAREFSESSGIEVIPRLEPVALAPAAELVVYRVVQEALTNIGKYARARRVWITLGPHEGAVRISVRDDGIGFDSAALSSWQAHGLIGMRFRVEAAAGAMVLNSRPGQGTSIDVRLPAWVAPCPTAS